MANKPNNPALWSRAKSLAKQKFDVYPSAYANGWASKWYKGKGGSWRTAEYGMEVNDEMAAEGGEKMPPEIARARFAAAGNLDQMDNYGYAYGGYIPEMMYGGDDYMAEGGEPNGGMALGQMMAVSDKMSKLRQFVSPEQNLDPWIASKLAVMDDSAAAIFDYMMYNPEAQGNSEQSLPMKQIMEGGGYVVTRSSDRKGKTHKVTGPDGTVKYFGDSNLGQHPKDPARKAAFYARHKHNLDNNPFFRAYARKTWEEGGQFQDGGKLTLPEVIVYGHKDPSTKAYFDKVRTDAEKWQDEYYWNTPTAGYNALEQMHSKYGAPKINTIREKDRPYYNPMTDSMNISIPKYSNEYGDPVEDQFLHELAHKVQANKKGKVSFVKDFVGKDLINTLKNVDSNDIFTKKGWLDAYRKNYYTPGTVENEAHSVIAPKLEDEYRDIRSKQYDRLYGKRAMETYQDGGQSCPPGYYKSLNTGRCEKMQQVPDGYMENRPSFSQGKGPNPYINAPQRTDYNDSYMLNKIKRENEEKYRDNDSLGENLFEFFDPTGASSWDNVSRTFKNPNSSNMDRAFSVASALPYIGKLGKAAKATKIAETAAKGNGFSRIIKPVGRAIGSTIDIVSGARPMRYFDQTINPLARAFGTLSEKAVEQIPNKYVRNAAEIGSDFNQTRRFWDGMTGVYNTVDNQIMNR